MQFCTNTSSLVCKRSEPMICKMVIGRSVYSEILFYTGLQQHSFNDTLVYCFAVVLVYNSKTSNKSISNGVRI